MLNAKDNCTDDASAAAESAQLDGQASRREWQSTLVDDRAHARQHFITELRHAAAEHDDGRIEEMHQHCDDFADVSGGTAHQGRDLRFAKAADTPGTGIALATDFAHNGSVRCEGLDTTDTATATDFFVASNSYMTDISGRY